MGQSQSSDGSSSGDGGGGGQEVKTSYYILLGIERSATEDEVKKAYRRKALELHPDRNYGNEEVATKTFAEVQAAYQVLSDPQERAWYDSHESAILRGDDGAAAEGDAPTYDNVKVTTADDLARMVRKFNSNVAFSDAPSGFFGFLRGVFEQLAQEEEIAANWEGGEEALEYPTFGHQEDEYGDVVRQFYAAWSSFSTAKSFSWRDKYRLSEAPDRWYRRRMEQENQRIRKEGKQEFNDAVRSLVAFIRKRDPRVVTNTQSEAERQKTLRDAAAAQAARARAANAAKLNTDDVPEWTKIREPEELEESEEEEIEEEVFECVACNKLFKSERQWEAHEKSKKHQKAIKDLQRRMRKQNINLDLEGSDNSSAVATPEVTAEELEEQEEEEKEEEGEEDEEALDDLATELGDHHARTNGNHQSAAHDDAQQNLDADDSIEYDDLPTSPVLDTATPSTAEPPIEQLSEASNSEDEDYASLATIQARMDSTSLNPPTPKGASNDDIDDNDNDDESSQPSKPRMGKAAQKRAKKAAAAAAVTAIAHEDADGSHRCQICNADYPSKTKLFQHIEKEGHAALKSTMSSAGGAGKGRKGKGKR